MELSIGNVTGFDFAWESYKSLKGSYYLGSMVATGGV
jgi:hypothetical protein